MKLPSGTITWRTKEPGLRASEDGRDLHSKDGVNMNSKSKGSKKECKGGEGGKGALKRGALPFE